MLQIVSQSWLNGLYAKDLMDMLFHSNQHSELITLTTSSKHQVAAGNRTPNYMDHWAVMVIFLVYVSVSAILHFVHELSEVRQRH